MLRVLPILVLLSGTASGCPEDPEPPCTCTMIGYHSSYITCSNVQNDAQLKRSMNSMQLSKTPVRYVEILDSEFNFLPSDLFSGLRVPRLFIAGTTMNSLSDTEVAFVGLEDSLETLEVHESSFLADWSWSHLKNLRALRKLETVKVSTIEVDEDVKEIAHLDLRTLLLMKNSITYLHDTAFSTFHNMVTLSLKSNPITEVKRSMFPDPATELQQLILSSCEIHTLPNDLFVRMPRLHSVKLEGNQLITIREATFAPVWNQLTKLSVLDNPLLCDCRIGWLLKVSFPKSTWARCAEPDRLKGKELQGLAPKDLRC